MPKMAAHIYKWVESNAEDGELKGQALFNLGMIYHFGSNSGLSPDFTSNHSGE